MLPKRDILIITAGRALQIITTFVSVRVFTSYLSKLEVGNLYLINSLLAFFIWTLINPIGMYINRNMHRWADEGSILDHFFLYNGYLLLISILSIIVVFAGHAWLHIGSSIDLSFLILFIMFSLYVNTWFTTITPSLNLLNYRVSFVVFTSIALVGGLLLSYFMVRIVRASALHWLYGQLIAQCIVAIPAFLYFKKATHSYFHFKNVRSFLSRERIAYLLYFILPLGVTTFMIWTQNQSYRLILENTAGLEFLGYIGLGTAIASQIASAIESIMQQLYYPAFYSNINTHDIVKRTAAWNDLARVTIPAYLSLTLFVSCLAPFLVNIFASDKFAQATIFVVAGAWIELFRMTTTVLSSVAHAEMNTKSLIKPYAVGGAFTVLGVYLGSKYQVHERIIPIILFTGGLITVVIMYSDMKKLMSLSLGSDRITKALLLSLPFGLAIFAYPRTSHLISSVAVTGVAGLYFLLIQYVLYREGPQSGSPAKIAERGQR